MRWHLSTTWHTCGPQMDFFSCLITCIIQYIVRSNTNASPQANVRFYNFNSNCIAEVQLAETLQQVLISFEWYVVECKWVNKNVFHNIFI